MNIPNEHLLDEDQKATLTAFVERRNLPNFTCTVVGVWKTNGNVYADLSYGYTPTKELHYTSKEKRYYVPAKTYTNILGRERHVKSRWKLVG